MDELESLRGGITEEIKKIEHDRYRYGVFSAFREELSGLLQTTVADADIKNARTQFEDILRRKKLAFNQLVIANAVLVQKFAPGDKIWVESGGPGSVKSIRKIEGIWKLQVYYAMDQVTDIAPSSAKKVQDLTVEEREEYDRQMTFAAFITQYDPQKGEDCEKRCQAFFDELFQSNAFHELIQKEVAHIAGFAPKYKQKEGEEQPPVPAEYSVTSEELIGQIKKMLLLPPKTGGRKWLKTLREKMWSERTHLSGTNFRPLLDTKALEVMQKTIQEAGIILMDRKRQGSKPDPE